MFEVNVAGLMALEGGRPPHRLAYEPVANVFDEYRGYGEPTRRKPTMCDVSLSYSDNPRGVELIVMDDGAGFDSIEDVYTFFGHTAKRDAHNVAGRFNAGDKQLLAMAREATVLTGKKQVTFKRGKRKVVTIRREARVGTVVKALMPWTKEDMHCVIAALSAVRAPDGLAYSVNGVAMQPQAPRASVLVTLPTVGLIGGVLRQGSRKCRVDVLPGSTLMELGVPICNLDDVGFPWSLDVQQKVPVPMSRDMVETAYLYRAIGTVLEQCALDGIQLLTDAQQGAGFIKDALEYVKDPAAMQAVVKALYGDNEVRQSSDPIANAKAAAAGATVIPGRWFGDSTRRVFDAGDIMPTSHSRYGGTPTQTEQANQPVPTCPHCGGALA